jgi:hypothetical protein
LLSWEGKIRSTWDQRGIRRGGPGIHAGGLRHILEEEDPGSMPGISTASEEEELGSMPEVSAATEEEGGGPRFHTGICNGATTEEEGEGPGSMLRIFNPQKSAVEKKEI